MTIGPSKVSWKMGPRKLDQQTPGGGRGLWQVSYFLVVPILEVCINEGIPKMDGLFHGKSIYKWMTWGYPYFRKNSMCSQVFLFRDQHEWLMHAPRMFEPTRFWRMQGANPLECLPCLKHRCQQSCGLRGFYPHYYVPEYTRPVSGMNIYIWYS